MAASTLWSCAARGCGAGAGALARGGAGSLRRARAVLPACVRPVDHEFQRWRPAVGAVVELYPAAI